MKAREKGGVVDERLNVYGVEGLKIAGAFHLRLQSYLAGYLLRANDVFTTPRRSVDLSGQRGCGEYLSIHACTVWQGLVLT